MRKRFTDFLLDDGGAITVDWVFLTAGVATVAIATTGVLEDVIVYLSSLMDGQLRTQQISDDFVGFEGVFWEPLLEAGLNEADAQLAFAEQNDRMNHEIIQTIAELSPKVIDGSITATEAVELWAAISVGLQRNTISEGDVSVVMEELEAIVGSGSGLVAMG